MMITQKNIALIFGLVAAATNSASAFAPSTQRAATTQTTRNINAFENPSLPLMKSPSSSSSSLSMSDNPADEFMRDMDDKATNQLPDFLYVDVKQSQDKLAQNWGWITTSGVLTMALGTGALLTPLFATGVAYDTTVIALGASGVIGVINAFARENGHKTKSALSGALSMG
eukprot:CAMPEP_0178758436 /NCGR_PEP_ID=MMETSP0744-20121128/14385_1 /TAXON_ID=913974 /ORGANISM="Nitzschia punctata, Strain CCMP561" /LENGTH=170 /DNA_ID=CAMNT_0020412801 /DNA_START=618 /DNA_END=1126 /DNA_ORIENTATION=+